jgi:hypothetical protein
MNLNREQFLKAVERGQELLVVLKKDYPELKLSPVFTRVGYRGLTREVYAIHRWIPVPENGADRWAFEGVLAPENIRQRFRYKSIAGLFPHGAANPIKYVCC